MSFQARVEFGRLSGRQSRFVSVLTESFPKRIEQFDPFRQGKSFGRLNQVSLHCGNLEDAKVSGKRKGGLFP